MSVNVFPVAQSREIDKIVVGLFVLYPILVEMAKCIP